MSKITKGLREYFQNDLRDQVLLDKVVKTTPEPKGEGKGKGKDKEPPKRRHGYQSRPSFEFNTRKRSVFQGSGSVATVVKSELFQLPTGVTASKNGVLYVADQDANCVFRVDVESGEAMRFVGTGECGHRDGDAEEALFNGPYGVTLSRDGKLLYVADTGNHVVRVVDLANGRVRTRWGTPKTPGYEDGKKAKFKHPCDLAITSTGIIYATDYGNHRIRRLLPDGSVTTVAGSGKSRLRSGPALLAAFRFPLSLALSADENTLYITDFLNHAVRRASLGEDGRVIDVETLAGTGKCGFQDTHAEVQSTGKASEVAMFNLPFGVCVDPEGNILVADEWNQVLRKIDDKTGTVYTAAGNAEEKHTDGDVAVASFAHPYGICMDHDGRIFVADSGNKSIRMVTGDLAIPLNVPAKRRARSNGTPSILSDPGADQEEDN